MRTGDDVGKAASFLSPDKIVGAVSCACKALETYV